MTRGKNPNAYYGRGTERPGDGERSGEEACGEPPAGDTSGLSVCMLGEVVKIA